MNKVILMGRLVRDPETRTVKDSIACNFTLAVDRRFKNASGERQADFINCVAWRQTGEFVSRYFTKGSMVAVIGSIQTSTWEKDGVKQHKTDVNVDEAYFTGKKEEPNNGGFVKTESTMLPFDV